MLVRIRLKEGPTVRRRGGKNRGIAAVVAAFLTPAALMCCVLALWRIGSDLKLTGEFAIPAGPFSKWQVWGAFGFALQACAWILNRYGFPEDR